MTKVRHDRAWVSERPKIRPKAKWTQEEDEKLLQLKTKLNGKWDEMSIELSHSPYECVERWTELRQQFLRAKEQQQKEPKLMLFPSEIWDPQSSRNASQLVSKADKKAGNSISESDSAQLGTVVVANSAALEVTPGIDAAMPISLRNTWESMFNVPLDDLANDTAIMKLRVCEEKVRELRKETDQLVKQKDLAIKETHLRRAELDKVKDHVAFLEAAVVRAGEKQRNAETEVEAKVMEQREAGSLLEKQFLLAYIYALKAEFQRTNTQQQMETNEDLSKRHFSYMGDAHLLTKHVESSLKNLDKPSKRLKISSNFEAGGSQGDDAQWNQGTVEIQEEEVKGPSAHDSTID